MPQKESAEAKEAVEQISEEDMKFLREECGMVDVAPDPNSSDCEIPAFATLEQVTAALRTLEIEDLKERRLKLYALF